MFCAQVWERLSPDLDEKDWAILAGLAEGRTQSEVAQELGMTQRAILGELGCEWL